MQALAEKGVSYTGKYTDLFNGQSLSPDYLAVNPKGTVPALIVEGASEGRRVIADSRWEGCVVADWHVQQVAPGDIVSRR